MDAAMAGGEALSMRWAFNANACSDGQRQGALTNGLQRRLMAATVAVEAFDGGGGWGPWIANLDGNAAFTCGGYGRQRGGSEAAGARTAMATVTVTATATVSCKSKNCH
jgi:hypothetical protein